MQRTLLAASLMGLLLLTGCFHEFLSGEPPAEILVAGSGVIEYIDLEGGFYGIVAGAQKYLPLNLAPEFQQDRLRVSFEARVLRDATTIHQWGIPVELIDIQALN